MKRENITEPITKCVEEIISIMKTPGAFLLFLTDMLRAEHDRNTRSLCGAPYDQGQDGHYALIILIEGATLPWLLNKPDYKDQMAVGIKDLYDYCGNAGLQLYLDGWMTASQIFFESVHDSTTLKKMAVGYSVLFAITAAIADYNSLIKKTNSNEK